MPPRELVWSRAAIEEFQGFLSRRVHKEAVLAEVEQHLLAVAADPTLARLSGGPLRELIYRFHCKDGDSTIFMLAVFAYSPPNQLAVIRCGTQPL